jgi:hypothetical protein
MSEENGLGKRIIHWLECCYPIYDYIPTKLPTADDFERVLGNLPVDTVWRAIIEYCKEPHEFPPTPQDLLNKWENIQWGRVL